MDVLKDVIYVLETAVTYVSNRQAINQPSTFLVQFKHFNYSIDQLSYKDPINTQSSGFYKPQMFILIWFL